MYCLLCPYPSRSVRQIAMNNASIKYHHTKGFIIDGTPYGGISGDKDMDSDSPPLVSALKKRNSPTFCWGLGLNKDTFKTVKVILLGQPGVGKSGE